MHPYDRFIQRYGRLPTERDPDYLELLRMSKYRILNVPDKGNKAQCANCGCTKNDGRKYIDFGLDIDWWGIVYLCGLCLVDISQNMGLFEHYRERVIVAEARARELEELVELAKTSQRRMSELSEELGDFESGLRAIVAQYSASSTPSVEPDENATGADNSPGSDRRPSGGEAGTPKPTSGTRRANVSGTAKLLNFQ